MRIFALLLTISASAQPLRFEVASIRPTAPILDQVNVGFQVNGQSMRMTAIPLSYYIGMAYNMKASQVIGPSHLQDRFDISATLPEGVKQDKLPEMVQSLLEDRFQLKTHRENRDAQVYVITQGKGPLTLQESTQASVGSTATVIGGGSGSQQGVSLNLGDGSSYTFANNKWESKKLTFAQLAEQLELFLDHPMVDQTNLKGRYDLTLEVSADDYVMMRSRGSVNAGFPVSPQLMQRLDMAQFSSLFPAFERAGLKIEIKKLPQPVLVVDSVLKTPTEN